MENEEKKLGGRPTKYDADFHPKQVLKYALLGLTDKQMANLFDISEATLNNWKNEYPEFLESIKSGKDEADANVVSTLYKKALGFSKKRKVPIKKRSQVNGEGSSESIEIVEVEDYYPPEAAAIFFWLKNRQPEYWRDKKEVEIEDKRTINTEKLSDSALDELENALKTDEE